jgi:hypothetical protein
MHGPVYYAHSINYRLVKQSCLPDQAIKASLIVCVYSTVNQFRTIIWLHIITTMHGCVGVTVSRHCNKDYT